ncbi:MAG: hypothetical protein R3F61_06425 [Myxococcota bacterium]
MPWSYLAESIWAQAHGFLSRYESHPLAAYHVAQANLDLVSFLVERLHETPVVGEHPLMLDEIARQVGHVLGRPARPVGLFGDHWFPDPGPPPFEVAAAYSTESELRWYKALVRGETPAIGEFYQTLWIARHSRQEALQAAFETLSAAGDNMLDVESCDPVEAPTPGHPDVSATGRAYFDGEP